MWLLDEPTEQEKAFIGPKITRVRRAQGCNSCSHTGYVGRRAIHEILCVDNQMRRMITQRTPMEELRSYATHYLGMESLTDEALKLVAMVQLLSRSLRRWHTIFKGVIYDRKMIREARSSVPLIFI